MRTNRHEALQDNDPTPVSLRVHLCPFVVNVQSRRHERRRDVTEDQSVIVLSSLITD